MTQHELRPGATPQPAAGSTEAPEQDHGDLRKAAYLRRRAAYQLQAAGPAPVQAGDASVVGEHRPSRRRR